MQYGFAKFGKGKEKLKVVFYRPNFENFRMKYKRNKKKEVPKQKE